MNGCETLIVDLFYSFMGLVVGSTLGFSLGFKAGKKRR